MTEWKNNKDNMERVMKMYHAPECWDWVRAWRKAEVVGDKLEQENKEWIEQYHLETNRLSRELVIRGKKLEAISILLTGTCESYDEGHCEPDCDGDADYEHCLTRKILEVLGN